MGRKNLTVTQSTQSMSNLHKPQKKFSGGKSSKIQIHSGRDKHLENIEARVKKGKKMHSSQSTHKLEMNKSKGLTSTKAFKMAPKINTKRELYKKAARRDKINLVISISESLW